MRTFDYTPRGVCSRAFRITLDDNDCIVSLQVIGGCPGNLQGISSLLVGMKKEDAIKRLEGIRCGGKPTSCPDQIAQALKSI